MLAPAQRLHRSGDIAAAIRTGRRAGRGVLVVHLSIPGQAGPEGPRPGGPPARAGFVVSRAVGGAVTRNRVRRRLRHLVRERLGVLPAGAILVVRALPGAARTTYGQLGTDLDAALAAARSRPEKGGRR